MNENTNINCSASDIYYRILQIGSENIEEGVSLNELKLKLKNECLVTDKKNTEHIEQWFDWSFEHKEFGCKCPVRTTENECGCNKDHHCNQFDHHNICKRYLKKEALIDFSQLEQSHKYNQKIKLYKDQIDILQSQLSSAEESSKDAKNESNRAIKWAIGALVISALMGLPDWINLTSKKSTDDIVNGISTQTDSINSISNQLKDVTQNLKETISNSTNIVELSKIDSTNLEEIRKNIESINRKFYRLNKNILKKENE